MTVTQGILLSVPTRPLPPTIGLASVNLSQVSVFFTQPSNNGGREIISYTAVSTPGNYTSTVNQSTSGTIIFNNLPPNNYTFIVYATSTVGNSDNSASSNQVTAPGVPSAPSIGTATLSGTTITVPFFAPSNNGGSAITSYTCFSTNGLLTATLNQAGSGSFTFTGVSGTEYIFQVYATNAIGNSPNSVESNTIRVLINLTVNYILVAGGGGGGGATPGPQYGGGGGGGGVLEGTTIVSYFANDSFPVLVGAGGAGPGGVGTGGQGGSSSFNNISATGGGGGGSWESYSGAGSGGCGGGGGLGAGSALAPNRHLGGSGIDGQGFAGGNGTDGGQFPHPGATASASGGGGGGAGAVGQARSSNKGGNGGAGKSTSRGSFSGGGGGSGRTAGSAGSPGGGIGTALSASVGGSDGGDGGVNTGGGGGGGGSNDYNVAPHYVGTNGKGGNGGSGKVFIWYPNTNQAAASSPGATYTNSGGNHVYEFNISGSLTFLQVPITTTTTSTSTTTGAPTTTTT